MIGMGDDWAEDHHAVEILDEDGRRLAWARLPEGLEGITRLHTLVAEHMAVSWADPDLVQASGRVGIGIETDRGTRVQALLAAVPRMLRRRTSTHTEQEVVWMAGQLVGAHPPSLRTGTLQIMLVVGGLGGRDGSP